MTNTRQKNRGSILILASLFTFLCLLLAFTLFKILPVEYNAAQKSRIDIAGHYALDAGVKDAILWIETRPRGTVFTQQLLNDYNSTLGAERELVNNWTYTTNIELLGVGHFGITSQALYRNEKVREVKAQIIREGFSQYALFIDHWREDENAPPDDGPMVYGLGEKLITGPFHTNDYFILAHQTSDHFDDGKKSFVSGPFARMTHAGETGGDGDGNAYLAFGGGINNDSSAVPYNEGGAIDERYQRIVEGGRGNLSKVPTIDFPDTARDRDGNDLREKARGNEPFSGVLDRGVYVAADEGNQVKGGVYIVGDSEIELALDTNGNQVQKIDQAHMENAYFEVEEIEVEQPRFIPQQTNEPPEFVDEVIMTEVPTTVIVGYDSSTVVAGDGITTTTETPIYDTVLQEVPQIVSVPYDPDIHGTGPWTIYVEDPDNPIVYTTNTLNPIAEEDYDPDLHVIIPQPAGDRLYEVVEVTEDAGYQVPSGFNIEGGSASVSKGSTVLLDHEENLAKVMSGNLNGVTFADGNIESFKGTNKGSVTDGPDGQGFKGRAVVAAPELNKNIQITGDVLQFYDGGGDNQGPNKTLLPGELPANDYHSLGLIAHDVELNVDYPTSETSPLIVYSVILAGHGKYDSNGNPILDDGRHIVTGGFGTNSTRLVSNPLPIGRFELYGGIIEGNAHPWFLAPNGPDDLEGFEGELHYDPAAAAGLQNFPATYTTRVVRYSEYADYD
jgi:hypothetical protein